MVRTASMLALPQMPHSQHVGQSWIAALGMVTDAATLTCACVDGADLREAYFLPCPGRLSGAGAT